MFGQMVQRLSIRYAPSEDLPDNLTFKPAAGLDPIEIAVDIDLQQDR